MKKSDVAVYVARRASLSKAVAKVAANVVFKGAGADSGQIRGDQKPAPAKFEPLDRYVLYGSEGCG